MKPKNNAFLKLLNILAWIIFIGEMIKAGEILFDYLFSILKNSEAAKNISGFDLLNLKQYSVIEYSLVVAFIIILQVAAAYVAYLVINIFSKIKMANPFTIEVSKALEKISYYLFGIWVVTILFDGLIKYLMKDVTGLEKVLVSGDFIFVVLIVMFFAQIFKRGVELQQENDLTV